MQLAGLKCRVQLAAVVMAGHPATFLAAISGRLLPCTFLRCCVSMLLTSAAHTCVLVTGSVAVQVDVPRGGGAHAKKVEDNIRSVEEEVQLLQQFDHPNIVRYLVRKGWDAYLACGGEVGFGLGLGRWAAVDCRWT